MSATYGIAGLVDGFVNGRNVRNGWQDRKDAKERQKKMDELVFAQDARSATEHEKRMRVYDQNSTDWQQGYDDDQGMRRAGQESIDKTNAALAAENAGMGATDTQPVTVSTAAGPDAAQPIPGDPVSGVAANLGIPMGAVPNRTAEGMPSPEQLMEKYGGQTPAQNAAGAVRADAAPPPTPAMPPMGASPTGYQPRGLSPAISDELYRNGAIGPVTQYGPKEAAAMAAPSVMTPNYDHNFGLDGPGLPSDAAEIGKRGAAAVGNVAGKIAGAPEAFGDAIAPPINATLNYLTGHQKPPASPDANLKSLSDTWQQATTPALGATPPPAAAAPGPRKSNAPASAPPATKAMAETATAAMSEASTPAVQAAAEASATNGPALGVKPGDKVTEPQRKRAAASFIDQYLKVGAPIVIEEMLKQGQFEKAQKFQEFMDQSKTKLGMENWARAAFAATAGDMDTFAEEILQATDRMGYLEDGTTIVKEQSGFTYDKAGTIIGAKIVFKDGKTGNTFDQVFSSPDDLIRFGITLMSPEASFERYEAEQAAKNAAAAKAAEDAKPKPIDPAEVEKERNKQVAAAADTIFKASQEGKISGGVTLTYAEARAEAEKAFPRQVQPGQTQGPPMPPPVAYRPTN